MNHWKELRNYRRIKNESGEVLANIITVEDMDIEVSEEIFLSYSCMERRERYVMEDAPKGKKLSLEQLREDAVQPDYIGMEVTPSAEDIFLDMEDNRADALLKRRLPAAIASLNPCEKELIAALFFENISAREYAKQIGISHTAVNKQCRRILNELKKILGNFDF